jgi:Arc/MetJ-type ribon-helix-helix transcriptional regulator
LAIIANNRIAMPTTMNVAISPELKAHIDREIEEGRYASSSE